MLRALRVVRPTAVARPRATRAFAASTRRLAAAGHDHHDDHHAAPAQIYGPGAKNVESIPSDEEQATGLERLQLLGRMENIDVFDMKPLDSSRLGTMKDPILVPSFVRVSYLGGLTVDLPYRRSVPREDRRVLWLPG